MNIVKTNLSRMRKEDLLLLAFARYGHSFSTKTRKPRLIEMILNEESFKVEKKNANHEND